MNDGLHSIDLKPFADVVLPARDFGIWPVMDWLPVKSLVIDHTYQRYIVRRGGHNVVKIAREFEWAKFGIVLVAPAGGKRYAVIDGQHRVTAAALCKIDDVPCLIVEAKKAKQAALFAAINGNSTALTPLQIHHAKVAAGDKDAIALAEACAAADVEICRYPVPANHMKVGQTLSVSAIDKSLKSYGRDVLVSALRCITMTGDGNVGLLRAHLIAALCDALDTNRGWVRDEKGLLRQMGRINLSDTYHRASVYAAKNRCKITPVLTEWVSAFLVGQKVAA